ncbi:restriction endonuclease subunit S [Parabacteroides merdae]|uniref:Restriction endonuclease subunit S n=1 Tax=Parabacteroides merdae TaxID=46503 RepID=A0A413NJK1_9BACT|nr:restriction endonuclease subunit S [Parabacteroides merdae]
MAIDNKDKKILNVPPLRFPEFSGEWKCTTIGNIGDIKNGPFGSVLHAEDYVENGIPIVTTEHFKTGLMPSDKFGIPQVSNEDYIRLKGYRLETNDIVFSRVGSVDINAHVGIEQNGWLFSGRVLRVRPKYDIDSLFLHYALSTEAVKRDIRNRAVGQTMPSINTPILSSTTIQLPKDLFEQKKVAHFLRLLDERIITQNKIIEKLQSLIKGIAQHCIKESTSGNTYVKLGDICQITTGKLDANAQVDNGIYPFFTCAEQPFKIDSFAFDTEALLISGNGANLGYINYYKGKFNAYQRTYVLDLFSENIQYIKWALKVLLPKRIAIEKSSSNTPYIVLSTLTDLRLPIPCKSKQSFIANLMQSLERKLSNQIAQYDSYNYLKQYLLRQMFI